MTIFAKLTVSWFARVREKRSGLPRARNLSGFLSKAGAFLSGFIFFAAHFAAVKQDKKSSLIKPPFLAYRTKSVSYLGASTQVDAPFSFV